MNSVRMIPKVMHTMHALSTPLACATDVTSLFSLVYFKQSKLYLFFCAESFELGDEIASGGL